MMMHQVSSFCLTLLSLIFVAGANALANPYPDPRAVAVDAPALQAEAQKVARASRALATDVVRAEGKRTLRVTLAWNEASDTFQVSDLVRENSGTDALFARATKRNPLGSYHGIVREVGTGRALAFDAIGTGQAYRKLVRALTFRFPLPAGPVEFELLGEDPRSGEEKSLLKTRLDPNTAREHAPANVEVRLLQAAQASPKLAVNVYADGYFESGRARFFEDAAKVAAALRTSAFPLLARLEIRAVFAPSNTQLGKAQNLGLPVPERDSFLGLYYPYWFNFGRWYNVVYPTREQRYRDGLASVPYDYAIAVLDSNEYWGVGNFNELTAIPSRSPYFNYLLHHELGHFFGLNEEYNGGGPTELEFAPEIQEPWSQNITFLRSPLLRDLKWSQFVAENIPLPTPWTEWQSGNSPRYGAYQGGYADSEPRGMSHIPGDKCMMESGPRFCRICLHAIEEKVRFDLGASAHGHRHRP